MCKCALSDGSCMPSASPPLVFLHLGLSDLILQTSSHWRLIREFLKTFKTLFIFTVLLVSTEVGSIRLSGGNS